MIAISLGLAGSSSRSSSEETGTSYRAFSRKAFLRGALRHVEQLIL